MRSDDMTGPWPRIGIFPACTDQSMPIIDLARAAEERGFTSIFLNEHPHLPVEGPRSVFPPAEGVLPGVAQVEPEIPERYKRFWDPFVALAFVAAHTTLEIGTAVSLVGEHDAIALAKAIATLDHMSGGRFTLGFGFGWHREEFEDHGLSSKVRADVALETVELMTALWTSDVGAYEGTYRRVSPSWSWPKPAQQPHVPVLLGSRPSRRNFERVARCADGWIPMGSPLLDPSFPASLAELREVWSGAGRDPARLRVTCIQNLADADSLRRAAASAAEWGVERMILGLRDDPQDKALHLLDRAAAALLSG